jgi:hypothetical protein
VGPLMNQRTPGQATVEPGFLALLLVAVLVGLVGVAELVQVEVGAHRRGGGAGVLSEVLRCALVALSVSFSSQICVLAPEKSACWP